MTTERGAATPHRLLLLHLIVTTTVPCATSFSSFPSFRIPGFGGVREQSIPLPSSSPVGSGPTIGVPLGIGTWAWGNQLLWGYDPEMDAELQDAFNAAVDAGVTFFDTGDSYGTGKLEGRAEELLGKFRAEYPDRARASRLVMGTKLATYPWRITAGSMEAALRASLVRLGGGERGGSGGGGGGGGGRGGGGRGVHGAEGASARECAHAHQPDDPVLTPPPRLLCRLRWNTRDDLFGIPASVARAQAFPL